MAKPLVPLSLAAFILVAPLAAAAQARLLFSSDFPSISTPGAPFQGKLVGSFEQTQPDGTVMERDMTGSIARDSSGRIRIEEQQGDSPITVEVLDPVKGTSLRWTGASTAAISSIPLPRQPWHVTFPSSTLDASIQDTLKRRSPEGTTTEDLGGKTLAGLVTAGTRTTTVESTGKLVREIWFSEELKIAVTDTFTEPRGQQNTIEIRDITRAEPDAALFDLPRGYTVKDQVPLPGGGIAGGLLLGGISGEVVGAPPPPPAPSPGQPRIMVDESVEAAKITSQVQPDYPPVARAAHVTGTVMLHVIIGEVGTVIQMQVLSGHPLLVQAALSAVKQRRYMPTLLDGNPVEVDTTVSVPFVLDDKQQ